MATDVVNSGDRLPALNEVTVPAAAPGVSNTNADPV